MKGENGKRAVLNFHKRRQRDQKRDLKLSIPWNPTSAVEHLTKRREAEEKPHTTQTQRAKQRLRWHPSESREMTSPLPLHTKAQPVTNAVAEEAVRTNKTKTLSSDTQDSHGRSQKHSEPDTRQCLA